MCLCTVLHHSQVEWGRTCQMCLNLLLPIGVGKLSVHTTRYLRMTFISDRFIENEIGKSLDSYHYPNFTFEYILYFNFNISYDYNITFLCGVVHVKY